MEERQGKRWKPHIQHTIRREARVEALSAIAEVEGATDAEASWTLDEGDAESSRLTAISAISGSTFDATGNADSSVP